MEGEQPVLANLTYILPLEPPLLMEVGNAPNPEKWLEEVREPRKMFSSLNA